MLVSSTYMLLYSPFRRDLLRLDSGFQAQNARFLPGCDMRTDRICSLLTHACSVIDCVKHLIVLEHLCHTAAWTIFVNWTTVRALESCLAIVAAIAGDVRLLNCVAINWVDVCFYQVGKSATDPTKLGPLGKEISRIYNDIAKDTRRAVKTVGNPEVVKFGINKLIRVKFPPWRDDEGDVSSVSPSSSLAD